MFWAMTTRNAIEDAAMACGKITLAGLVVMALACMPGLSFASNLLEPEELKMRLDAGQPTILVDIQPRNAFNEHHFSGSIRTFAYPAKTERDTNSLVQAVRLFKATGYEVVIIGQRGTRAEERSHDFLAGRGIPEEKLFILKGGIDGWPYREMLLIPRGGCN
jgi:hypothetical protein